MVQPDPSRRIMPVWDQGLSSSTIACRWRFAEAGRVASVPCTLGFRGVSPPLRTLLPDIVSPSKVPEVRAHLGAERQRTRVAQEGSAEKRPRSAGWPGREGRVQEGWRSPGVRHGRGKEPARAAQGIGPGRVHGRRRVAMQDLRRRGGGAGGRCSRRRVSAKGRRGGSAQESGADERSGGGANVVGSGPWGRRALTRVTVASEWGGRHRYHPRT